MPTYVVTAGHSNKDPGAIANGYNESDIVTDLRNIIVTKMRGDGYSVFTDGDGEENWSLAKAAELLESGNIGIELHCNSADDTSAHGVECFSLPEKRLVAQNIAQEISQAMGIQLRGDYGWKDQKESARESLLIVNKGGTIVELFFITNTDELNIYLSNKEKVADAIINGLTHSGNIFRLHKRMIKRKQKNRVKSKR